MGGHGGLNILPQKRWNVYNFDNREKVRKDEEEAAKEEQLKREQSRKRDAEFRLERLRTAKGLAPLIQPRKSEPDSDSKPESEPEHVDAGHINLFEGIKIFDPIRVPKRERDDEREEMKKIKKMKKEGEGSVRAVGPEDEKYRLGYGVAGKGVQLPWYVQKQKRNDGDDDEDDDDDDDGGNGGGGRKGEKKKKTLEELREERLKRERREKEREKALRQQKQQRHGDVYGSGRFTRR